MKKGKRTKKEQPVHLRLPDPPRDKTPGIFVCLGHSEHGEKLMPLQDVDILFRRADGVEFRVEFVDRMYLAVREVQGSFYQRLSVQPNSSNVVHIGVSNAFEDET